MVNRQSKNESAFAGGTQFGTSETITQQCFEDRYFEGTWEAEFTSSERAGTRMTHKYEVNLTGDMRQYCYCLTPDDAAGKPQPPKWMDVEPYNEVTDTSFMDQANNDHTLTKSFKGKIRMRASGFPKLRCSCTRLASNPYVGVPERKNCECSKKEPYKASWYISIDQKLEEGEWVPTFDWANQDATMATMELQVYRQMQRAINELTSEGARFGDGMFKGVENPGGFSDADTNFLGCDCTAFVDAP